MTGEPLNGSHRWGYYYDMTTRAFRLSDRQLLHVALGLIGLGAAAHSGAAQGVRTLDRGSFTITVNGTRAGREDFTISSTPVAGGVEYLSRATVSLGERRLNPKLMSDSGGKPSRYEVDVRGTSGTTERWMGGIVRGRVAAKMENPRGVQEREYVVADGALLLDDDVYHQYYFVVQRASRGIVPVVIPRRNIQVMLKVSPGETAQVSIGTATIDARHFVLTEPTGTTREVWVDATGRVLKVSIPDKGIIAIRDDPPGS